MQNNMSIFDRTLRALLAAPVFLVIGGAVGPTSPASIIFYVLAAVMLATAAVGFCPLYALFHVETRCRKPLQN